MWSDGQDIQHFTSTGTGQFAVHATGGFALNTTPVNPNVTMTIQASSNNPGYASIFMHQATSPAGIMITSGDGTNSRGVVINSASFYLDEYDGTNRNRLLSLNSQGLSLPGSGEQAYQGGGGPWAVYSDARLKTNVQPLENALKHLLALRGVTFEYAHPDNALRPAGTFTGFIAQEVAPIFPSWIGHDDEGYLTLGPQGFEALTVEALRTLKMQNDARISKLERESDDRIAKLEAECDLLHRQLAVQTREIAKQTELERDIASLRQQITGLSVTTITSNAPGMFLDK